MKFARPRVIACVLPVLLWSAVASAQTLKDLQQSVTELKQSVAALAASVENLAGDVSELKTQGNSDDSMSPARLRQDLKDLSDFVNENSSKQQEILDSISVRSSGNKYVPRISANMQDPDFAMDFHKAVTETYPDSATLLITNSTDRNEEIVVNGKQYNVMSGASRTFDVPIGYSTLRLDGEESVRWYIGAPTFKEHIAIETKVQTATATKKPVVPSSPTTVIYDWSDSYYASPWYPVTTATPWRVVP